MDRLARFWDRWWRTAVSLASVAIFATMAFVTSTVLDERTYFEQEQDRDRRQDQALADLLEAQKARSTESAEQGAAALGAIETLLLDHFAAHDQNVALKLNEMLRRIESLLGRPAGEPLDPVTAQPYVLTTPAPSSPAPSGATAAPRVPSTTTTTHPRCANGRNPNC